VAADVTVRQIGLEHVFYRIAMQLVLAIVNTAVIIVVLPTAASAAPTRFKPK